MLEIKALPTADRLRLIQELAQIHHLSAFKKKPQRYADRKPSARSLYIDGGDSISLDVGTHAIYRG